MQSYIAVCYGNKEPVTQCEMSSEPPPQIEDDQSDADPELVDNSQLYATKDSFEEGKY